MQFAIPQFIEREAKIVGPFTFKQMIYIGGAGLILFFLYFSIPFLFFILAAIILLPLSLALAILKVGGVPLPVFLKNFFLQIISPKVYIWRRVSVIKMVPRVKEKLPREKEEKEEKEEELPLKIAEKSRLKKLITELETRIK